MSAWNSFRCTPVPGREDDLRAMLRDIQQYSVDCGAGSVMMYRTVFGGELSGFVSIYQEHADAAARASFIERTFASSAENPALKALAGGNAPYTDPQRSTFRSLDTDGPPAQQSEIIDIRGFTVDQKNRVAAERALTSAVAQSPSLGGLSRAFVIEAGGAASGRYAYSNLAASVPELEEYYARLIAGGSVPIRDAADQGVLILATRQIARRFDV
jgi:hypothetical protein